VKYEGSVLRSGAALMKMMNEKVFIKGATCRQPPLKNVEMVCVMLRSKSLILHKSSAEAVVINSKTIC